MTFVIEQERAQKLYQYAEQTGASPFALFMTVLSIYISRVKMNAEQLYIGTAVLNRAGVREKNTMGMYINTVPCLIHLDNSKSFYENLMAVKALTFSIFRHQKYQYSDVLAAIREEAGSAETLFDVLLSYQNAKIMGTAEDVETTWYHSGMQSESLQLHIDDRDTDGVFRIHFDYRLDRFSAQEVVQMYEHLCSLLFDAIANDNKKIWELELLSPAEKDKLLHEFNDTAADYPKDKTVHQLFEEQAERTPDRTALIACDRTMTYRELNEEANRIAHGLIAQGVTPGDLVAFMLPRTSRLIAAMLGILKAGAAYVPIDPEYPKERRDYIVSDSCAKLVIDSSLAEVLIQNKCIHNPNLQVPSNFPCYCIYTSGSTGKPKGTLLHHRGIINLILDKKLYSPVNCDRIALLTTITFDVATQELLTVLLHGYTGILMPEKTSMAPSEVVEHLKNQKVDMLFCTPTYLDLLCSNNECCRQLVKTVKAIVLAGEKFYLNRNLQTEWNSDRAVDFYNQYGPAETHVITSAQIHSLDNCTIGKPIANTQIYIVDKYLSPVPIGVTGELCIAGDGVGLGYLNRPELTAERFIDNPFGEGKLYKTGDLAYWREDGNIAYVGRNDFQVKVRGLRIELSEIENVMQEQQNVIQTAVLVRKDGAGHQYICAFYTGGECPQRQLRDALSKRLPQYMVPHVFIYLEAMPLTSSGKINRRALPEVDLSSIRLDTEYIAPTTETEKLLAQLFERVLGHSRIGCMDNFFELGGDSLKAIELAAALEDTGWHTEVKTIFSAATMGELAGQLTRLEPVCNAPSVPTGDIPATDAQLRVYTAQAMQGGTAYNVPYVFRVKEEIDPVRLQAAVDGIISRHEILRTHFENRGGRIVQVVEDAAACKVERLQSERISDFIRPFDLERGPLLRIGFFEKNVMVDMHHIITDGSSMPIFFRELNELYMGRSLTDIPVQYCEFAAQDGYSGEDEAYWQNVFREDPPILELNTDYPRGTGRGQRGAAIYDFMDGALHSRILRTCNSLNITPYVFYLGAFEILLSKFSGNEDICIGTPASGRSGKYRNALGMFVNTVVLRGRPESEKPMDSFLLEVKDSVIGALAHQSYPYGTLVKKLGWDAPDRNPLFDVMFVYQSEQMTQVIFGDEPAELLPIPITTSKYDMTFNIMPREKDVVLMAEYCTELYHEQTIRRMIQGYKLLLEQMA